MKLAFVMQHYLPMPAVDGGAVEGLTQLLIDANEAAGIHSFTVFCRDSEQARAEAQRYVLCEFRYLSSREDGGLRAIASRAAARILHRPAVSDPAYLRQVLAVLKKQAFDAVIAENCYDYVPALARASKAPVIFHMHNRYCGLHVPGSRRLVQSCRAVLCVSQFLKNEIVRLKGVDTEKIRVYYNCIECSRFRREQYVSFRNAFRAEHGILEDDVLLLYVGRLVPEKGVLPLMEAFFQAAQESREQGNSLFLLIVGSAAFGTDEQTDFTMELKRMAADRGANVIFTGGVPHADVPKYYACADIACVPSLFEEPAGLTVIEAMASSLAAIVSDAGGIPEYASPDCAVTVPRNDQFVQGLAQAISLLAAHPELRAKMGAEGAARAAKFDASSYYNTFLTQLCDCGIDRCGGDGNVYGTVKLP